MALEMVAAHANIVAHELVAELERFQSVAADTAVAQADNDATQDGFELILQFVELIQRMDVLDLLTDAQQLGGELAGPFRCDAGDLGIDRGQDRTAATARYIRSL